MFSTRTASAAPAPQRGPLIVVGHGNAIVETQYGKVRGYTDNGIHTFKGIPYGESTGGKARFPASSKAEGLDRCSRRAAIWIHLSLDRKRVRRCLRVLLGV